MFIKICGMRNETDFSYAIELGATAVGCIVGAEWECPDELELKEASSIFKYFKDSDIYRVVVTHKKDFDTLSLYLDLLDCNAIQFHGNPPLEVVQQLRRIYPEKFFIGVAHGNDPEVKAKVRELIESKLFNAILIDTKTETRIGGTGLTHDWSVTASLIKEYPDTKFILAGGLNPHNVAVAIKTVKPWGVDVNSGVKASNGTKERSLLKSFAQNARIELELYQNQSRENP